MIDLLGRHSNFMLHTLDQLPKSKSLLCLCANFLKLSGALLPNCNLYDLHRVKWIFHLGTLGLTRGSYVVEVIYVILG